MSITFGKWLFEKRKQAGFTQDELAVRANISPNYVSALERAEPNTRDGKPRQPRIDKVDSIAKALGVDIDEARFAAGYAPQNSATESVPYKRTLDALARSGTLSDKDDAFLAGLIEQMEKRNLEENGQ